jgi:uncharacterized protein with von Willebrand factor type A (vWA) domain
MRYRYSRWNGVQTGVFPDADDLLDRFADELLAGKDPQRLLQNALQRGIQDAEGGSTPGIRDLFQEIDAARQRELARFDVDTVLHDIAAELAEIAKLEGAQLDGHESPKVDASSPTDPTTQQLDRSMLQGQQPDPPPGGPAAPDEKDRNENPALGCDCCGSGGGGCCDGGGDQGGAPSSNPRPGDHEIQDWDQKSSGVLAPAYDDAPTNGRSKGKRDVRNVLSRFASRRRSFLAGLPASPAAQFGAFTGYDFVAPEAWERFRRLRSSLADRLKQHYFPDLAETMSFGEGEASFRDLVDALNRSLQEEAGGAEGALADFQGRHRDHVDRQDDMVAALSRQIALMESLLASLTPEVREQLEQLKAAVLHDELPAWELTWLQANVTAYQRGPQPRGYRFSGQEALDLGSALDLMDRLDRLHRLQQQLQTTTPARIDEVDAETVRQLLGEEAYEALGLLQETCEALQRAGYLERRGARLVLTARGIRKLGDRAARDIFAGLKRDCLGRHQVGTAGIGFDRMDEHKSYEFGDPFILDAEETIRHAVVRGGAGCPVRLVADDFVVYRSEALTRAATVLMLDLSRSMIVRGCFVAARRVALALHSLIRERFPQDTLYVLGFSDRARELALDSLPEISWDDHATNMQDAFRLARRLLGRHSSANRQIVLVTDGEPTAHLEGDRVEFSYPPSPETLEATLREVRCCTRDRIVINTFMLERGHYLTEFVEQMARINRGRAFFATPERLGEYVLADYLTKRILRHLWP